MDYQYDIAVIGAGPGGYETAIKAAQMGKKTCIIESTYLGGTCLNVGCIPTKALIQTADVYHKVKDAARFAVTGVEADKIAVDMAALQARKKAVVKTLVNGVKGLLRGNKVTVVEGMASFADTHTLSVDGRSITGANIIIATGSSVFMPPFIALEGENHLLTSTEALDLDQVPASVTVIGGGVMLSHQADPKDTVIDAFKSITAEGQLNPSEEIFGTKELEDLLQKGSAQTGMELSMTGISDESLNQMSGAGIGLDVKRDVDSGRQLLNLSLQYGGGELADAQLYMDDTQIMAAIPVLSSRMFTLDYANDLEGQLINSPYAAQKLEEQGIDIEGLANYLGQYKEALSDEEPMLDLKALWNRYKEGSKAIDDLKAAMTVTKNDKKEFTIDGQSENCRGYHVILPKDALISFAKTTREFFLNDETLKQDVVRYLELAGGASSIYAADGDGESVDPEEQQKELWAQAEAVLDNLVEEMENTIGDVTMDVYVRKDGKMAGFSYETDATVEEENVRLYGDVSFGGGYNMLSNVNGALNIEDSEGQVITISLDKAGAYEAGKSWSGQVIATLEDDEEKYQFILDGDYQIADGSYELKLDLQSNGASQASITANGAVSELSKGESVHIDMDSLRMETTLLNGSISYVELAGSYYVNPLEDEIAQPDGVPFDVLASSEEDYNQVTTEITGNLFAILLKVMS